jgi:sulfopyruvate decarboxylase TPP-binding subunit
VQLYRIPCFFLVSYRGDERDPVYYHAPKGERTEPTLAAWSIRHVRAGGPARIGAQIRQAVAWVEEAQASLALSFSAEDLA